MKRQVTTCGILLIALSASGHESKNLDELPAGRGSDPHDAVVKAEALKPGLHALYGAGFNLGRGDPTLFSNMACSHFAH
ncbi:MAG: hypothetical protein GXP15_15220 [Gammaproteobacteria bacterium]|nr:hypothetical protein [Gammaproteobacteria bacterium]